MSTKRFEYHILSGEGVGPGTWQIKIATRIGIKRILTAIRGDRWALAYYETGTSNGQRLLRNYETGEFRHLLI